jgi:hypothetical protein
MGVSEKFDQKDQIQRRRSLASSSGLPLLTDLHEPTSALRACSPDDETIVFTGNVHL